MKEEQLDYLLEKKFFYAAEIILSQLFCCGMDVVQFLLLTLYITLFNTRKLSKTFTKLCINIWIDISRDLVVTICRVFERCRKIKSLFDTLCGWVKEKLIFTAVVPWFQNFQFFIFIGRSEFA